MCERRVYSHVEKHLHDRMLGHIKLVIARLPGEWVVMHVRVLWYRFFLFLRFRYFILELLFCFYWDFPTSDDLFFFPI